MRIIYVCYYLLCSVRGLDSSANAGSVNTGVNIAHIPKQGFLLPVRTPTSAL